MERMLSALGRVVLELARDVGGVTLVAARAAQRLVPPRIDRVELVRSLHHFGEASLPIVALTAAFTGLIMVLQGALYVRSFGVYDLVGWYTGFATFREVGPVLIGLMFSGRVGAANASELATMHVTEQLDALRVLAIDVYEALILPRVISMTLALTALVILGDLVAVVAGAGGAWLLLDLDAASFARSLTTRLAPADFLMGVGKGAGFGLMVALVSTHFGLAARGGSRGVGRAVNAQVVACALAIFAVDYLLTAVLE